jgi:hypothetical protein
VAEEATQTPSVGARTGEGPLTASVVTGHALGLLRLGRARVVISALVLFLEPAVVGVLIENVTWQGSDSTVVSLLAGISVAIGLFVSLLTPVFFAGYLDEVIGKEYFDGHRRTWKEIARELPWGNLIVADILLIAGIEIGLALLIVPGIVFCTWFALVGPVVVQERRRVIDAFRRTYRISVLAVPLVLGLVVVPLLGEGLAAELLHQVLHHASLGVQVIAEWLLLATLGGAVGLLEVALATELMRRNPEPLAGAVIRAGAGDE